MARSKETARAASPSEQRSFRESTLNWTGLLEARYNQSFIEAMRPMAVTVARFRTLVVLNELSDVSVGELARHTSVERSALGRLLEKMESEGLVLRRAQSADRRVLELDIAPRGREQLRIIQPVRRMVRDRAIRGISAGEIARMIALMQRMLLNLDAEVARSVRPPAGGSRQSRARIVTIGRTGGRPKPRPSRRD